MQFCYDAAMTPKEVLLLLVDLNERYHGRFERVHNEMSVIIDDLWQELES